MPSLPDDIATLVRDAARAVPGPYGDTEAVVRRARRYRRRRAGAVIGAAAVVIVSAVTVPVLVGRADRPVRVQPAGPTASAVVAPAKAQRLLLSKYGELSADSGQPEVTPDGSLVGRALPRGAGEVVVMPDGRLVTLVTTDLQPGVNRPDGPDVDGVSIRLAVLRADGSVQLSREVRKKGEEVRLLGASDSTAYLRRSAGVVAHDLATGGEQVILPPSALEPVPPMFPATDLTAGRLAVADADGNRGCTVRVADVVTGETLPVRRVSTGTCVPDHVRVSPDGRLVAVAYLLLSKTQKRVAVVDLETGRTLVDKPLGTRPVTAVETVNAGGVAWSDNRTVRIAVTEVPPGPKRTYRLAEVLRVVTVTL